MAILRALGRHLGAVGPLGSGAGGRRGGTGTLPKLTDEAIAAHQRVSLRTVQRRVQALMLATGTRTRMQLAWQAAQRGWLTVQPGQPLAPAANGTARPG